MLQPNKIVKLTEAPSSVITLANVKTHLGIYSDTQFDSLLTEYIATASEYVGNYIGQPIGTLDLELFYSGFDQQLIIPYTSIDAIQSVEYYNTSNVLTTVPTSQYFLDDTGEEVSVIFPNPPSFELYQYRSNPVKVTIESDLHAENESATIRQAIYMLIAQWFKYREATSDVAQIQQHHGVNRLLNQMVRRFV